MKSHTSRSLADGLTADLAWTRRHVLAALDGLDADALGRSYVASGWSPLTLLRHLTLDVERFWFRGVMLGEPEVVQRAERGASGWHDREPLSTAEVLDGYRSECMITDAIVADLPPETPARWRPYPQAPADLLSVLRHVVVETACHAGHLDIVRESIDAHQYLVVDQPPGR